MSAQVGGDSTVMLTGMLVHLLLAITWCYRLGYKGKAYFGSQFWAKGEGLHLVMAFFCWQSSEAAQGHHMGETVGSQRPSQIDFYRRPTLEITHKSINYTSGLSVPEGRALITF
jgi:hypothetical protein